jgi:hypothetical protein
MTTVEAERAGSGGWHPARWVVPFFAVAAVLLLPWIVVLAALLPANHAAPHWDITWVGFDAGLSLLLISVAYAAWKRSAWLQGAATAAATLLLVDAWFDVTTSASRVELITAVVAAALVEVPLATLCLLLARDTERVLATRWMGRTPRN